MRKFGPFDTSVFYEVENRRLQRALAVGAQGTGFVKSGQGAVTAGTGAQLVIAAYPDGALVDGLYVENPDPETVTVTANTGSTNPRIDRLVMRLDMGAKTIAPFQIVGTPAASPSAPSLTQNATVFDMPLCRYTFPGSASAQNPGSIVDERILATNIASVSGVLAGAAPPAGTPLLPPKIWTGTLTTNAAGDNTITFPGGAFPNGVVAVSAHPIVADPNNGINWATHGHTLDQMNVRATRGTAGWAGTSKVSFVIWGW